LEEGETNARSTKAKKMDPVPDDEWVEGMKQ
jgi:hypothetical protein